MPHERGYWGRDRHILRRKRPKPTVTSFLGPLDMLMISLVAFFKIIESSNIFWILLSQEFSYVIYFRTSCPARRCSGIRAPLNLVASLLWLCSTLSLRSCWLHSTLSLRSCAPLMRSALSLRCGSLSFLASRSIAQPTENPIAWETLFCGELLRAWKHIQCIQFFFPKLCLILKNRFLAWLSSNFQERLLMKYFMPQFIFGVSIFSLRA